MKPGDLVRWRKDVRPGGEPMEIIGITMVRVEGGANVSAALLEVVTQGASDGGDLMPVIEAQMAEIDRLRAESVGDDAAELLEGLCLALGYDRRPMLPTGIPALDEFIRWTWG